MSIQQKGKNKKETIKKVIEAGDKYTQFFLEKDSKKFVLYHEFPSLGEILDYYFQKSFLAEHPIQEYGRFDIRELAELIKYLYSFYYQEEYRILTFGYLEKSMYQVNEGIFPQIKSNLCFLIGNDRSLESYDSYRNLFLGSEQKFDFSKKKKSLICLKPTLGTIRDTLGITCKGIDMASMNGIGYYDVLSEEYKFSKYLSSFSLFCDSFYQKLENYSGIWDTFSFGIHEQDRFLSDALISIAIFKKNQEKLTLSNEDYQYLFYEMFRDNRVNIKKAMEKEIPKTLKYVPRSRG